MPFPRLFRRFTGRSDYDLATHGLWFWQIMAAAVLIALTLSTHELSQRKISESTADAKIINISGLQRMLSQRILYFGEHHYQFGDAASRSRFKTEIDRFEQGHFWLLENAVEDETIRAHYFDANGANLHDRTVAYISDAHALLDQSPNSEAARLVLDRLVNAGEAPLLDGLDTAVALYENAAEARLEALLQQQLVISTLTILVVLAEVFLIFHPLSIAVSKAVKRLDTAANEDALTGLMNRRCFLALLEDRLRHRPSGCEEMVVVTVDLDGFKAVNDTLGHAAGDAVLVYVSQVLTIEVTAGPEMKTPLVARLGGDEFVIAFSTPVADAPATTEGLAQRLLDAVSRPVPIRSEGRAETFSHIGMSIGYALASETAGGTEALIANADQALYQSKRSGKRRVTRFEPWMREIADMWPEDARVVASSL